MQLTDGTAESSPAKPASERNQLALQVLHEYGVTPEHIETRTLYNDDCPGIPQVSCKNSLRNWKPRTFS